MADSTSVYSSTLEDSLSVVCLSGTFAFKGPKQGQQGQQGQGQQAHTLGGAGGGYQGMW